MTDTRVIGNPQSGSEDHTDRIEQIADDRNATVEWTEAAGDAITLAADAAAAGASTIVAAGGDGTVNEVVRGIDRADAFDDVTLAIFPLGTGNNFATQLGIPDLETAITVLESGERRRIDLGWATDRPVVNSCVAGLTANASDETDPELKRRFGEVAYLITTLRELSAFDGLRLTIDASDATGDWTGEALGVLVGNGRRFTTDGDAQADMEDALFDVVVIKDVAALDLVSDSITERLFDRESDHIVRSQAPSLTITNHDPETIAFSLDGEFVRERELTLEVRPATLRVAVGEGYEPTPE
ncbi:diacylglycerol/lipid kinase family protein [Halococcoides cellulosivorans]|uniref:Diacylglycerol kinase n=1 Tax=Halococcoides cellulosivorans TaxID=1679096 RepID=A0A2R4X3F4_9EURY|nr:YegS/Rv2252/BmrU family lipid kinase [Halococcoides cellulosivorans]AWB28321.1 diacylglycerol kinase [Halococcoides cellulosivorans]